MESMSKRLQNLGFSSKRKSTNSNLSTTHQSSPSPSPAPQGPIRPAPPPPPPPANASTTTLPMNPNQLGRPPSYTYHPGGAPVPPNGPLPVRAPSQMMPPPGQPMGHPPPGQVLNAPPPINTAQPPGYPPQGNMGVMNVPPPPPNAGPPQYAPFAHQQGPPAPAPAVQPTPYGNTHNAVEVEGAGRSKAQLIVGIDFVGVQFPFSRTCRLHGLRPIYMSSTKPTTNLNYRAQPSPASLLLL